jgi:four helix bundle protein
MNRFKQLLIWQKAIDLTTRVYQMTDSFPSKEQYKLVSQLTRCAVSIPSNIAEGAGRNSDKEFVNFLSIAVGSSFELETQLIISNKLGYIDNDNLSQTLEEIEYIQNMTFKLQQKLKANFKQLKS